MTAGWGGRGARMVVVLCTLTATAVGGCAGSQPSGTREPEAGFRQDPPGRPGDGSEVLPQVRLGVGDDEIVAEVAFTADQRALGLMHREELDADRGMLFVFPGTQRTGFWMKNTLIELSIAFMVAEADGFRVVEVLDMQPCRADPCPSYVPRSGYDTALEVNRSRLAAAGVGVGDLVMVVAGELPAAER